MNNSLYNGISGMKTHQFGIDVWAANITGINTTGFKASNPEFASIYNSQLTNSYFDPTVNDVGFGSSSQTTSTDFSIGTTITTENKYDLAINGKGWFGVLDDKGEKFYTRAGAFQKDKNGFLVDNQGNFVTGTSANNYINDTIIKDPKSDITFTEASNQTKINIPDKLIIPATPTTEVNFSGSLNSDIETKFSPITNKMEEVSNTEIYRTKIFAENGDENSLEIKLTKVVPQGNNGIIWNAKATLQDPEKNIISTSDGQITFNERGAIISNTLTEIDNNGVKTALNFGTFYDPNIPNSGFNGLVSLSGFESARTTTKNGNKQGNLKEYGINNEGVIIANFDNGENIPISKVAVYNFKNEKGLESSNPVYFKETANSGKGDFYRDKDGNTIQTSSISSNKLEMSNLDISTALTELLIMQKAYDASSKSITTSDQMIQNAINMKK
jgi:flagellar hook-basal body protein